MKYKIKMIKEYGMPYKWCEQNLGKRGKYWGVRSGELDVEADRDAMFYTFIFSFKRKRDATMFSLVWK